MRVDRPIEAPHLHVLVETDDGLRVFAGDTRGVAGAQDDLQAGERVVLRVEAVCALGAGRYYAGCQVRRAARDVVTYRRRACDFTVHGTDEFAGLVTLEHTVALERAVRA